MNLQDLYYYEFLAFLLLVRFSVNMFNHLPKEKKEETRNKFKKLIIFDLIVGFCLVLVALTYTFSSSIEHFIVYVLISFLYFNPFILINYEFKKSK